MELDQRKQVLLQAIVVTYVRRAEPVGSQLLASQESLGVRSATIRNEMAEMTELGYLLQPHTSAGRVPSDLGYRYYVDHLMPSERLPAADSRAIRAAVKVSEGDLEQLLYQTSRILSSLTRYTSVVTAPASAEPVIRHVHLAQVSPRQLLTVVVLENGQVIHRFCETPRALSPYEVTSLGNVLDELLGGVAISAIPETYALSDELASYESLFQSLLDVIRRGVAGEESEIFLDGTRHILEQPEFRDANRVEPLVRFLEERKSAFETLQKLLARRNVTVSIGQENPHAALQEISVVAARYDAGARASGWVGVIGPTRMHYGHAVSAVRYAARALSDTLSRLGYE